MAMGRPKREVPEPTRIQRRPKDLRDEFALAVLPGICSTATEAQAGGYQLLLNKVPLNHDTFCAQVAYGVADAMMAEREKNNAY